MEQKPLPDFAEQLIIWDSESAWFIRRGSRAASHFFFSKYVLLFALWGKRALQIALEEDPPVSVNQVLGRLGIVKNGYPSRLFPELCNAVAKRYSEFRKSRIAEKRKKTIAEIKRVALEMHATGIPPHYRKICPRLSLGGMYLPEGRAAFRQIKEELGVELR